MTKASRLGAPGLTLLELSMLSFERMERADIVVHPVEGLCREGFAISVDGDWLRGGTHDPALFETALAACRLMEMLRVPGYRFGEPRRFDPRTPVRCYRRHGDALTLCRACPTGRASILCRTPSELETDLVPQ